MFFFRAFRGGGDFFPQVLNFPPNNNKFCLFFRCFSHFLYPQKQFPPLNYISRKNLGSKENNCHIKLTNRNTIQGSFIHIMLVCYTTKPVNFEWLSLQHFLLLSPISKLPCMLQPVKLMTTQWDALLRKELT